MFADLFDSSIRALFPNYETDQGIYKSAHGLETHFITMKLNIYYIFAVLLLNVSCDRPDEEPLGVSTPAEIAMITAPVPRQALPEIDPEPEPDFGKDEWLTPKQVKHRPEPNNDEDLEVEKIQNEIARILEGRPADQFLSYIGDTYSAIDKKDPADTSEEVLNDFSTLFPYGLPVDDLEESVSGEFTMIDDAIFAGQPKVVISALPSLASAKPDVFKSILVERSRQPPVRSDLAFYYSAAFSAALNADHLSAGGYHDLLQLRDSENPIYRALIAQMMVHLESDEKKRLEFYESFLPEDNPVVAGIIIRSSAYIGGKPAEKLIRSFGRSLPRRENENFYKEIDDKILGY